MLKLLHKGEADPPGPVKTFLDIQCNFEKGRSTLWLIKKRETVMFETLINPVSSEGLTTSEAVTID